ncbi:hypothetical protein D3C81_1799290 [compost metagenome]
MQAQGAFGLDTLALGAGGVGGDEGVGGRVEARDLQVLELRRIGRQVQRRPPVQQGQLGPDLERLRSLALELECVLAAG